MDGKIEVLITGRACRTIEPYIQFSHMIASRPVTNIFFSTNERYTMPEIEPHKIILTNEKVESVITKTHYYVIPDTTVTICCLTLENGFNVVGKSACISAATFDAKIGRQLAFEDAKRNIWELEAYRIMGNLAKYPD